MRRILILAFLILALISLVGCFGWGEYRLQWQGKSTARGGREFVVRDQYYCFMYMGGSTQPPEILFADVNGVTPKGPVEWSCTPAEVGQTEEVIATKPAYRFFLPAGPGNATVTAYAPEENKSDSCTVTVFPVVHIPKGGSFDVDGDSQPEVSLTLTEAGYDLVFPAGMRVYSDNSNVLFPSPDNFAAVSGAEAAPGAAPATYSGPFDGKSMFVIVNGSAGGVYLMFIMAWTDQSAIAWRKLRDAA